MDELDGELGEGATPAPMHDPSSAHAYAASEDTGTSVAVHAGFPNPAAERTGVPLRLDKLLIKHPSSTYFFRIRGHSWQKYGIFDGDIAIIDRAIMPQLGDLVVWWESSGEFTLSRFRPAALLSIWGTVTAVIHSFKKQAD